MNKAEKLTRFFEQLRGKGNPTAQDIRNAAAATGDCTEIIPEISAYAAGMGIDATAELSDLAKAQDTARHKKDLQEKAASLEKKAGALIAETDPEKQKELIEDIRRLTASMGVTAQSKSPFYTAAEYLSDCNNYDPSKDFTPSMLAGLRFPNGTLSYIGARPGGGKSALLINLAREAITAGRNVVLVNLEMINRTVITNYALSLMYSTANNEQRKNFDVIDRPMSEYYSLFRREYDSRKMFDSLRQKALRDTTSLLGENLFLYDGAGKTVEVITRDIESVVNAGDIVLIDYLQRILPPRDEQRYIQIKQISNALLTLALQSNVVIISGAQFGRQKQENRGNEATLEDFREGGDTEQDAHNALAIETITDKNGNDTGRHIHVLKQREGGAVFKRTSLECNFKYLYMAGTGKEYITEKSGRNSTEEKKVKTNPDEENHQTFRGLAIHD